MRPPVTPTKKLLLSGALLKAFLLGGISIAAAIAAIVHAHGRKPLPMFVPIPPPTEIPAPELAPEADPDPATGASTPSPSR